MGIYLVAIVENSKGITLEEFSKGLFSDKWGRKAFYGEEYDPRAFEDFFWEGKQYFTWISSPREPHIGLFEREEAQENPRRVLLFKIFLVMEKLAGGPIYTSNDVLTYYRPDPSLHEFYLPFSLDSLWPEWREVAASTELEDDVSFIF